MKKIPSLYLRNPENMRELTQNPNPLCDWVFNGEGVATRKIDGTCCKIDENGKLWKRREVKHGKGYPAGFQCVEVDHVTDKRVGWVPVSDTAPEDKYHREGLVNLGKWENGHPEGTYELIGPKIQGNPELSARHILVSHTLTGVFLRIPTDYEALKAWLVDRNIEGLVWHHKDGRRAKIKKRDFNLKR